LSYPSSYRKKVALQVLLHCISGEIYWTDTAEDVIQKATPDGQHIESIIVDGLETADGIVVDSTGRKVAQKIYNSIFFKDVCNFSTCNCSVPSVFCSSPWIS
jgi:hypothetical protein